MADANLITLFHVGLIHIHIYHFLYGMEHRFDGSVLSKPMLAIRAS